LDVPVVGLLQIGTVENGVVLKKRGNCGEKFTVLAEEMKLVKLLVFTKKSEVQIRGWPSRS
jgi:hypothetical protein